MIDKAVVGDMSQAGVERGALASTPLHEMLASLAIPSGNGGVEEPVPAADLWRYASRFVTDATARALWLDWNPDQAARLDDAAFVKAFNRMLADGVGMGFSVDRFRQASRALPQSTSDHEWITAFEDAIGGTDVIRLRLHLSTSAYQAFKRERPGAAGSGATWAEMLRMMSDGLFYETGLTFPAITVLADDSLNESSFRWEWNDLRLPPREGLEPAQILVNESTERLALLGIEGAPAISPANGAEFAITDASHKEACESAGLTTWDARSYVILALSAAIRRAAGAFVNRPLLDLYLLRLGEFDNDLVDFTDEAVDRNRLVQILRGLVAEEICIRDLSAILTQLVLARTPFPMPNYSKYIVFSITDLIPVRRDVPYADISLEEHVANLRTSLKRYITHKHTRGSNTLQVWLVDSAAEARLLQPAPLGHSERIALHQAVRDEVGGTVRQPRPVILTTMEVRHRLWAYLQPELPDIPVLSYQELSPDVNITPLARISPELKPYDEAFVAFLESLPSLPRARVHRWSDRADELSSEDRLTLELIERRREDIIVSVRQELTEESDLVLPRQAEVFDQLVSSLLDGCLDTVVTGHASLLDDLFESWVPSIEKTGIKYSNVANILLTMALVIRRLAAAEYEDSTSELSKFTRALQTTETMVHRAVGRFVELCVGSRVGVPR